MLTGVFTKSTVIAMKKLPKLKSDQAAKTLVDEADLTTFDVSEMTPVRYETGAEETKGSAPDGWVQSTALTELQAPKP